jgi:signal transduction histidine kinase
MYVEIAMEIPPYPGFPDFFFLMSYPVFIIGVAKLPVDALQKRRKFVNLIDLTAFLSVSTLIIWQLNFRFIVNSISVKVTDDVLVSFLYTVLDFILLAVLFYRLTQNLGEEKHFIPTFFLVIGGFFLIGSDIFQGYDAVEGFFTSGSILDLGWLLFSTFCGLAAIKLKSNLDNKHKITEKKKNSQPFWTLGITYSWIVIVFFVLIWALLNNQEVNLIFIITGAIGAILLAISRQVITLKDNLNLVTELKTVNVKLQKEIVKQKEAEEKVKRALVKEKELSDLKTRFISIASHEFRTPLATIYSSTELLEAFYKNDSSEKFFLQIERIRKNIDNLVEIIDNVLLISRADSGIVKYEPAMINIKSFMGEIVEDTKALLGKNHKLDYKLLIPDEKVMFDEKLFKIALMNLLSNAIKYSSDGGVIGLEVTKDNNKILFKISDQGIGITEMDQKHLFEPFHRAENVGHIHGTGLGLVIVKKYVELHNGEISFVSSPEKGTIFNISLAAGNN